MERRYICIHTHNTVIYYSEITIINEVSVIIHHHPLISNMTVQRHTWKVELWTLLFSHGCLLKQSIPLYAHMNRLGQAISTSWWMQSKSTEVSMKWEQNKARDTFPKVNLMPCLPLGEDSKIGLFVHFYLQPYLASAMQYNYTALVWISWGRSCNWYYNCCQQQCNKVVSQTLVTLYRKM